MGNCALACPGVRVNSMTSGMLGYRLNPLPPIVTVPPPPPMVVVPAKVDK